MTQRRSFSWQYLGFAAVALFGAFLSARLALEARANREIAAEIQRLEVESREVESRNSELRALLEQFSATRLAEEEARTKLGLRSPGEQVVILTRRTSEAATTPKTDAQPRSNARRWWNYFFK